MGLTAELIEEIYRRYSMCGVKIFGTEKSNEFTVVVNYVYRGTLDTKRINVELNSSKDIYFLASEITDLLP